MKRLLVRREHNRLTTARDLPYVANAVFNADAADAAICVARTPVSDVLALVRQDPARDA